MGRRPLVWALVLAAFLVAAGPASAHRAGKAEPRIAAGLSSESGLERTLTVRLTDLDDSTELIRGATVVADAQMADEMPMPRVRLRETGPGEYSGRLAFEEAGRWTIRITVTGKKVVTARARLPVAIEEAAAHGGTSTEEETPAGGGGAATEETGSHGQAELTPLATTREDDLVEGDYVRMAMLWIHGLAAMGWIIGVLVMAAALSTQPGVLAETARRRLAEAYRSWGALAHWSLVPVIVGTGIYNMVYVTPFDLPWSPATWEELAAVPYGYLYEGILLTKLALFAVLLVTGTMTFLRTTHTALPVVPVSNPHPSGLRILASVLGRPGLVYLATVPLILAAAMALRYVHVLNHVAVVTSHQ
ncbi:MAG TPA: FixH family protein [Gaiellaceae bacterium]|nr:FixH family protein [Gaiellaceae bacterium]